MSIRTSPIASFLGLGLLRRMRGEPTKATPTMRAAGPARAAAPTPTRASARNAKPAAAPAGSADHALAVAEAVGRHNERCKAILTAGLQLGEVATAMALAFDTTTSAANAIQTLKRLPEAQRGDHADRRRLAITQPAASRTAAAEPPAPQAEPADLARAIAAVAERCRPQPAAPTLAERLAGATRTSVHPS
jgi:hypothetical protein